ncbi:MAG TPA: preprotein translocase subunit SecY [Thermodesulfobacteriota bacterium]|nr:preprotein translocase subunit SecY [Thermodesulfobacteriota bacterium]
MNPAVQNIAQIPELRARILFTLGLLIVYRLGVHIPLPGIDPEALARFVAGTRGSIFDLLDLFSGGGFQQLSIFALGIMPYISASIILQLLTVVIPTLEKLQKEGEAGRKKITQYTRYGTIVLSLIQSVGIATMLAGVQGDASTGPLVPNPSAGFYVVTVVTLTTGTAFLMWLGEQITERGIGNGISLIIFAGIVARLPAALKATWDAWRSGAMPLYQVLGLLVLALVVVGFVVFFERGLRRIPVQYAKRIVGRRVYGGQKQHLPLKVNSAGVIPPIFASSILLFPATLTSFVRPEALGPLGGALEWINRALAPGRVTYEVLYVLAIYAFAYFYTAIQFNPMDVAENLKKFGGYIPGIRPGKKTAEYIDRVLTRLTLVGATYLAAISVLPSLLIYRLDAPFFFGGTSLLIVVGVALDTAQQIEAHLITRHYEGFLKKGRIKGRRG